jgi:hypothetical protein
MAIQLYNKFGDVVKSLVVGLKKHKQAQIPQLLPTHRLDDEDGSLLSCSWLSIDTAHPSNIGNIPDKQHPGMWFCICFPQANPR